MAKRSLRLSPTGIRKAKQQFAAKGWTQEYLAIEVGIKTRQPIWRFFAGEPIERFTFFEICTILELDWREIALDPPAESIDLTAARPELDSPVDSQLNILSLDDLVQQVRSQRQEKINHQCGILKLLHISRPVDLERIYVEVNILDQIPSQQRLDMASLDNLEPEDIDRFGLGKIARQQSTGLQAIEKCHKLRILGRPGSGKSTFMKHLAIKCNQERFAASQVPIFITLRDFADSYRGNNQADLLEFIHQEFIASDIPQLAILKKLLQEGRILLLIDGKDEISSEDEKNILNEIRRFCEKYYKNQFVTSCRTPSSKLSLKGFTDIEIAPFSQEQITIFTQKWFVEFSPTNTADGLANSSQLIKYLKLPENRRFRQMMKNPLFLHLACSIFHHQEKPPINQGEFYKQAIYLFLGKWDEFKGIERGELYPGYSLPQKLESTCDLALTTFENQQFLFKKEVMELHVANYMQKILKDNTEPEELYQATEIMLEAAKAQPYGIIAERARDIFSFSYLALHEYLVARKIVVSHDIQGSEEFLQGLVKHITDRHWREIFLLTATMLRSGDRLVQLMKQEIDGLVAEDPYLQDFLIQAHQKLRDKILQEGLDESASPDLGFHKLLQQLHNLLPDSREISQTQQAIATYQEIINQWEFTPHQQLVLQHYYDANQLLLDCLNSGSEVTPNLREEIETTLLLPQTELGSGMTSPL